MSHLAPYCTRDGRRSGTAEPSMRGLAAAALLAGLALLGGCGTGGDEPPRRADPPGSPAGPYRSLAIDVHVTPAKAGSAERPQGVRVDLGMSVAIAKDVEPPQVERLDFDFPAGAAYGGDRIPACGRQTLERGGPDGCPPGSVTGRGTLLGYADTSPAPGRITVVNGGKDSLYLWTQLERPARVEAAIVGAVSARGGGGYRLALSVPARLQVVVGVPVALRKLHITMGRGDWLSTTGCPDGHWRFRGAARFGDGSSLTRETETACD